MLRVGVVLGAGGSVGLAFHGGVLAAIEEATGWDPRTAATVLGSSAGSLSGSLLRIGLPAADLRRIAEGEPLSPEGVVLSDLGQPHRPRVQRGAFLRPRLCADPVAVAGGLLAPWRRSPLALVAAALPAGPVPTDSFATGFDLVAGEAWPEAPLWISAVRLRDGRRVVFGEPGAPPARLGQAVAASCAVPGYFRPGRIGEDRYVDGGVASIHSLDLLAGADLDLVVVSAPMAYAGRRVPLTTDLAVRRLVRYQLDREAQRVRRSGVPVLTFAPTRRVLGAMGLDAMDARRRRLVSRMARASTLAYLERSGFAPMLEAAAAAPSEPRTPAA